jgi:hypothetical protein
MNELSQLTRQHYEKNETGNSLLSKVSTILDSLPDKPLESSQLAGLDQFGPERTLCYNVRESRGQQKCDLGNYFA